MNFRLWPGAEEWVVMDTQPRIISEKLWHAAAKRIASRTTKHVRSGYRPKYLLSGLLQCDKCKAHYIVCPATQYGCGSYLNGGKPGCDNHYRLNRKAMESLCWIACGSSYSPRRWSRRWPGNFRPSTRAA